MLLILFNYLLIKKMTLYNNTLASLLNWLHTGTTNITSELSQVESNTNVCVKS